MDTTICKMYNKIIKYYCNFEKKHVWTLIENYVQDVLG